MHNPLVSVLIPAYNRQDFILECINSALNQTYKNIEIIISDNCSTDQTLEICKTASKKDPRIKVVSTLANFGPVANWLNCFNNSSGQYIKLLFSDDLLSRDCIERMVPAIQDPEVGFVYSSVLIGGSLHSASLKYRNLFGPRFLARSIYEKLLYKAMPVSPCAMLYRRKDFERNLHMNFDSREKRDYAKNGAGPDVMLSILTASNYQYIYYVDKPLIFFRSHEGSFTVTNSENAVNHGYSSSICWFLYISNKKILWAKFILKYWIKDCIFTRKIVNFGNFIDSHEGVVGSAEFFWIFIASIFLILKLPLILISYIYFIICNKHGDLDAYTEN
jgi:glycosyltransferase involved in cell wall biosynthesis